MLNFIIATSIITIMPGPSMVLIMLNSVQRGLWEGFQTTFGVVVADAILLVLIMSGMGTVFQYAPIIFQIVKWSGVAYLVYLGIKQLMAPESSQLGNQSEYARKGEPKSEAKSGSAFLQGLGITLLNPKIIGFYIAFFPQFMNQEEGILSQLMVLGPVFLGTVLVLFMLCAIFARTMRQLVPSDKGRSLMKKASGLALIGCGILAATVSQAGVVHAEVRKTLVYCSESNPETFNPQIALSGTTAVATTPTLYDRLVAFEYGGTRIVPALAERWTISKDKKTYTFYLKNNVKFHKTDYFTPSRDFNADDVLFSFFRQLKKNHPYHGVGGGTYQYFQGLGMPELIQDVRKLDDYTVQVKLTRPEAPFLANLAMPFMAILSEEYSQTLAQKAQKEKIDLEPIGTGPFAFKRYLKGNTIRFIAHREYWAGAPKLDEVVFAITPDPNVRTQKLKKGECHIIVYPAPADLPAIEAYPGLKVAKTDGLNVGYLALNTEKAPFDQVLVRRAVAHALNKKAYLKAIYLDNAKQAINPIPPSMWSYNDQVAEYEYNPKKAREHLVQAGFPSGFRTTLWTLPVNRPYNPNGKKLGEMMQQDLAQVGIQTDLVTYDWGTYLEKVKLGEHEMIQLGWAGDNGDPDNFLYTLFSCDSVTRGSNNARFCYPEFERLIKRARIESLPKEREKLYRRAQAVFKEQTPVIPIAHAMEFRALSSKVKGYKMDPFALERFFMLDLEP